MIVSVGGSVDISIDVGDRIPGLPPAAAPILREEMVIPLRESLINGGWPVDTGASLQRWEIRVVGSDFVAIRNPIYYAEYVHRAGETVEVWTEIEALSEELFAAVAPRLRALARPPARQLPIRLISRAAVRAATLFAASTRVLTVREKSRRTRIRRSPRTRPRNRRSRP